MLFKDSNNNNRKHETKRQLILNVYSDKDGDITGVEMASEGMSFFEIISILEISKLQLVDKYSARTVKERREERGDRLEPL